MHLRNASATTDGPAAITSEERKSAHYARPEHVSFDGRRFKLVTLAVERFGRLGVGGCEFVGQLYQQQVSHEERRGETAATNGW